MALFMRAIALNDIYSPTEIASTSPRRWLSFTKQNRNRTNCLLQEYLSPASNVSSREKCSTISISWIAKGTSIAAKTGHLKHVLLQSAYAEPGTAQTHRCQHAVSQFTARR